MPVRRKGRMKKKEYSLERKEVVMGRKNIDEKKGSKKKEKKKAYETQGKYDREEGTQLKRKGKRKGNEYKENG